MNRSRRFRDGAAAKSRWLILQLHFLTNRMNNLSHAEGHEG
ncbi:hypothetical protein Agau_C200664 [Agrobacterium tumefaciens F2]|nr:hypothetical protein Agau_C200664 [Agrobacterium tumefaciens F2]